MAYGEKYVTQQEAVELAGVSYDTIRRRRGDGQFPNARRRDGDLNGTWEIPLGDLVASGLCAATMAEVDIKESLGRAALERELREKRDELARALARISSLEAVSESQASEIAFLRKLLSKAAA